MNGANINVYCGISFQDLLLMILQFFLYFFLHSRINRLRRKDQSILVISKMCLIKHHLYQIM